MATKTKTIKGVDVPGNFFCAQCTFIYNKYLLNDCCGDVVCQDCLDEELEFKQQPKCWTCGDELIEGQQTPSLLWQSKIDDFLEANPEVKSVVENERKQRLEEREKRRSAVKLKLEKAKKRSQSQGSLEGQSQNDGQLVINERPSLDEEIDRLLDENIYRPQASTSSRNVRVKRESQGDSEANEDGPSSPKNPRLLKREIKNEETNYSLVLDQNPIRLVKTERLMNNAADKENSPDNIAESSSASSRPVTPSMPRYNFCYFCHSDQVGHITLRCPSLKERTCGVCGQKGHLSILCSSSGAYYKTRLRNAIGINEKPPSSELDVHDKTREIVNRLIETRVASNPQETPKVLTREVIDDMRKCQELDDNFRIATVDPEKLEEIHKTVKTLVEELKHEYVLKNAKQIKKEKLDRLTSGEYSKEPAPLIDLTEENRARVRERQELIQNRLSKAKAEIGSIQHDQWDLDSGVDLGSQPDEDHEQEHQEWIEQHLGLKETTDPETRILMQRCDTMNQELTKLNKLIRQVKWKKHEQRMREGRAARASHSSSPESEKSKKKGKKKKQTKEELQAKISLLEGAIERKRQVSKEKEESKEDQLERIVKKASPPSNKLDKLFTKNEKNFEAKTSPTKFKNAVPSPLLMRERALSPSDMDISFGDDNVCGDAQEQFPTPPPVKRTVSNGSDVDGEDRSRKVSPSNTRNVQVVQASLSKHPNRLKNPLLSTSSSVNTSRGNTTTRELPFAPRWLSRSPSRESSYSSRLNPSRRFSRSRSRVGSVERRRGLRDFSRDNRRFSSPSRSRSRSVERRRRNFIRKRERSRDREADRRRRSRERSSSSDASSRYSSRQRLRRRSRYRSRSRHRSDSSSRGSRSRSRSPRFRRSRSRSPRSRRSNSRRRSSSSANRRSFVVEQHLEVEDDALTTDNKPDYNKPSRNHFQGPLDESQSSSIEPGPSKMNLKDHLSSESSEGSEPGEIRSHFEASGRLERFNKQQARLDKRHIKKEKGDEETTMKAISKTLNKLSNRRTVTGRRSSSPSPPPQRSLDDVRNQISKKRPVKDRLGPGFNRY